MSTRKGAALRTRVSARRLALVATVCRGCGTVDVYVGSKRVKRISLHASSTRKRRIIPIVTYPAAAGRSVKIVVVSSSRPVRIEGLGASPV